MKKILLSAATICSLFSFANASEVEREERKEESTESSALTLQHVPRDLILEISRLSAVSSDSSELQEKSFKFNLFNLGKVCKLFYSYFTSEYVIGSGGAGVQKVLSFDAKIRSLLNGHPEDMPAFRMVGAFNFSTLGKSMQLSISPYGVRLHASGLFNPYSISGEEVNIKSSDMSILTTENKAWPFSSVSKIVFYEYVSGCPSQEELMQMFPDQPEMWHASPCGEATFTVYGLDRSSRPISVSYGFYKPSI